MPYKPKPMSAWKPRGKRFPPTEGELRKWSRRQKTTEKYAKIRTAD